MNDFSAEGIAGLVNELLTPGNFFVGSGRDLTCRHIPAEEVPWEVFRGRLLDPGQTRERKVFTSWNLHLIESGRESDEPVLSLKLDTPSREIHVVRALLCHVWEAYESGSNIIRSRETTRWVRELVGTIELDQVGPPFPDALRRELASLLFQAVVGTSRLPLNSLEAPLPAFSLGQLAFFDCRPSADPIFRSYQDLITNCLRSTLSGLEAAKLLEFVLRTVSSEEIDETAGLFVEHWRKRPGRVPPDLSALFRIMFNEVSLSPYTQFVDNALAFMQALVDGENLSALAHVDFLSYLLRQTCRHLTAYDLITFHHRGANYPDALLLDSTLKAYLELLDSHPKLFAPDSRPGQMRRRALRQGLLLRRYYEGHPVPDAPTSPGENARVLPPPHVQVPLEQLEQPHKRGKRLYAGEPTLQLLSRQALLVLQAGFHDLDVVEEVRELGMAVFIDRPFGAGKRLGEPDLTPIFSHEAFSPSIVKRRLTDLTLLAKEAGLVAPLVTPREPALMDRTGFPGREVPLPDRPIVSLADAARVADDFLILRTLPGSVRLFLDLFHWGSLAGQVEFLKKSALVVPVRDRMLGLYDEKMNCRLEARVIGDSGFIRRGRMEMPAGGIALRELPAGKEGTTVPLCRRFVEGIF